MSHEEFRKSEQRGKKKKGESCKWNSVGQAASGRKWTMNVANFSIANSISLTIKSHIIWAVLLPTDINGEILLNA